MIEVLVAVGDEVEAGQTLAVMEAMKIEHLLTAPKRWGRERSAYVSGRVG